MGFGLARPVDRLQKKNGWNRTPCSQRINTDLLNKDPKQRAPTGTKDQEPRTTTSRIHRSLAHRNFTVSVALAAACRPAEQKHMLGHLPTQSQNPYPTLHTSVDPTRPDLPKSYQPTAAKQHVCYTVTFYLYQSYNMTDVQEEERTCVLCLPASVNFPVRRPHR